MTSTWPGRFSDQYNRLVSLKVCRLCGSDWERGEFVEACELCGGGAMDRACLFCGARCGSRWSRAVLDSQDFGVAHWHGPCALPSDEKAAIISERLRAAGEGKAAGAS